MNLKRFISLFVIALVSISLFISPIFAADPLEYSKKKPLGDVVQIKEAVNKFERDLNTKILQPKFIPFEVTYSGAKYNENDKSILITYLNEKTGALMDVQIRKKLRPDELTVNQRMVSLNGKLNRGIYDSDESRVVNFIYFYDKGLEYRVGITKRPTNYKLDTYINVAESFQ